MNYILGLIGITLLCAAWMKFQLWLMLVDPERQGFRPGCGACKSGSCSNAPTIEQSTIKIEQIRLPEEAGPGGNLSGDYECSVKKSPS